jgi:metal-responsive CopG/Arc/MetJ family transcriptional regulator
VTKKGFKKAKGEPAYWDEMKKRYTIALTPTAIKQLDELAKQRELSRSELVERIGRGIITLNG